MVGMASAGWVLWGGAEPAFALRRLSGPARLKHLLIAWARSHPTLPFLPQRHEATSLRRGALGAPRGLPLWWCLRYARRGGAGVRAVAAIKRLKGWRSAGWSGESEFWGEWRSSGMEGNGVVVRKGLWSLLRGVAGGSGSTCSCLEGCGREDQSEDAAVRRAGGEFFIFILIVIFVGRETLPLFFSYLNRYEHRHFNCYMDIQG